MAVTLADTDGDGDTDAAVAGGRANRVLSLVGDGTGALVPAGEAATGRWPTWVSTADLDGVLPLEVVGTTNIGDTVFVVRGEDAVEIPCPGGPTTVALGDLDGDGLLDAATANKFANSISLMWGDGAGASVMTRKPGHFGSGANTARWQSVHLPPSGWNWLSTKPTDAVCWLRSRAATASAGERTAGTASTGFAPGAAPAAGAS
jgi:hypothetical protein